MAAPDAQALRRSLELGLKQGVARRMQDTQKRTDTPVSRLVPLVLSHLGETQRQETEQEETAQAQAEDQAAQQQAAAERLAIATALQRGAVARAAEESAIHEEDAETAAAQSKEQAMEVVAKAKKKVEMNAQRGLFAIVVAGSTTIVIAILGGIALVFWKTMELLRTIFIKTNEPGFGLKFFSRLTWWELAGVVIILFASVLFLVCVGTLALIIAWASTHKGAAACLLPRDVLPFYVAIYKAVACP